MIPLETDGLDPEPSFTASSASEPVNQEPQDPSIAEDDEAKAKLLDLILSLEIGDRPAREELIPVWKRQLIFWRGIQRIYWNAAAKDWQVPSLGNNTPDIEMEEGTNGVINIYRAYGESITAALTASVPVIQYFPFDAENIDDIMTAKAYSRIEEKIRIENQADIKLVEILFFMYNCGFVAVYNEQVQSEEFGVETIPIIEMIPETKSQELCPLCSSSLQDSQCEGCNYQGQGIQSNYTDNIPTKTGEQDIVKGRQFLRVYGPLNVKIPHYVRDQSEVIYLILEEEFHYASMRAEYPLYRSKITPGSIGQDDRGYRADIETGEINKDLVTRRKIWLKPQSYEIITDDDIRNRAYVEFPEGCRVTTINNIVVEVIDEKLDDVWSIAKNPLALTLHADPIGAVMMPIQEMRNDLVELVMETVRQGIPETFVDPEVLDLQLYGQVQAKPGQKFPVKAKFNKNIGDSFYTQQGSTLSKEVQFFLQQLDNDAQFVTGAYPSIYGGQLTGGGKTLGEYESSKNQSLQRLSIHWKTVVGLWTRVFDRATRAFHKNMTGDEKFVKKSGNSYENIWIKEIELSGKVGDVRAENSDQFPISWAQKRSLLMDILNLKLPQIDATVFHPENIGEIARTLGWSDLFIPGERDRNAQLLEINELIQAGQPDQSTGQSTVAVDPDLDAHEIHIEVLKAYLTGPSGIELRRTNPTAYMNVKLHLIQHNQFLAMTQAPGGGNEQEPGKVEPVDTNNQPQQDPNSNYGEVK